MTKLRTAFFLFLASIVPVDAMDAAKAKAGLIIVDGIFYVAANTVGKVLIGGQWASSTGSRAFYLQNRKPSGQAEWNQLLLDMASGGAGVADYLRNYYWALDTPQFSDMLVALKTSGISEAKKQEIYTASFWNRTFAEGSIEPGGGISRYYGNAYDYSGWDISNVNFQQKAQVSLGLPGEYGDSPYGDEWVGIDLSNLGFTVEQLSQTSLSGLLFRGQDLSGLVVSPERSTTNVQLVNCNLTGADLRVAAGSHTMLNVVGSDMSGANLSNCDLSNVYMGYDGTSGVYGNLSGVDLRGCWGTIGGQDAWGSAITVEYLNLNGAKMYGSSLYGYDGNCNYVCFDQSNLFWADWNP